MVRYFSADTTEGHVDGGVRVVEASDSSAIVVDADFLFSAEFVELGSDLLLRGPDGEELLLRDYFAQDPPPPLETAEGARLLPEMVDALAHPEIPLGYAQAGDVQAEQAIGEVRDLDGIARVQRADGTRENLNEGDPIFQGDVVSTGVGSELGIVFVDDTVFSLSASSRMVIDELIYDPGGSSNSMGISLIQGTFVFVTGKVAPSGGIDVDTPVGTIGIRGTTVGVQIATFGGATRITNLQNPDTGELGSFVFSNGAGSALFSLTNHFLSVRSAAAAPGDPTVISGQSVTDAFGRALNRALEIQRNLSESRRDDNEENLLDQQESQLEAEQLQALEEAGLTPEQIEALLSEPAIETAAGPTEGQPLGEGSSFSAGLQPSGLNEDGSPAGGIETTSPPPSPSDGNTNLAFGVPGGNDNDNSEEILLTPDSSSPGSGSGNQEPVLENNSLTVQVGGTVVLSAADLSASDADSDDAGLLFTVSDVIGGQFELLAASNAAITSFTQQQVADGEVIFVHDGGDQPPSYSVAVSDGLLTTDPVPAAISFETFPAPPAVSAQIVESECIEEDTPAEVQITATPTTAGDSITEVVVEVPEGWRIAAEAGGQITAVDDSTPGQLVLTVSGATFPDGFSGIVTVTPPEDSDVDGEITVSATAIDGSSSASASDTFDLPVDANADAGPEAVGGDDDGDSDVLSVSIDAISDSDDAGSSFQTGESGTVAVTATFDDFQDGSETHGLVVTAPEGFVIDAIGAASLPLPAGVTFDIASDGSSISFSLPTDAANGLGSFSVTLAVTNLSAADGAPAFTASATASETQSDDTECDDTSADNLATVVDSESVTVANVSPLEVTLSLPDAVDCLKEDSTTSDATNVVSLAVSASGDDEITEIEISGLQTDWVYDFSGLEVDGATLTDSDASDGSITLSLPNLSGYAGSFALAPPADSDVDHPTISATATAVDAADAAVTTSGQAALDVAVDAVADGGANVTSGDIGVSFDGAVADLDLSLTPQGGNADNPDGDAFNGGGFDGDDSEAVTAVQVTLSGSPAISDENDANLLFSPDFGGAVDHSDGTLVWTFTGSEAELQDLVASLQVDPGDGYVGTLSAEVTVTTQEAASDSSADRECEDGDNAVSESFTFDVEVVESLSGKIVINEVGLGVSEAQTAAFDTGAFNVEAGLSYIELRNIDDDLAGLDGQSIEQLDIEIVGPDGSKVTIDLSTLSGNPESHGLAADETLVLYEDGTWAIYGAGGEVRDGDSFGSFSAGAPWGVGESTGDALAVNLIQEALPGDVTHVDALLANNVDTSGLSQPESEIWTGAGTGSTAAAGLLGGLADNQQYNGLIGDQWAVLTSILTAGQRVLGDPQTLNEAVNDGVDDITRVFARVYADAVPGQTGVPGDGLGGEGPAGDTNQAQDWTTSNQSTQGAVNQSPEDFNPQDALDDLDPAQGAGSNDGLAGQTVVDVSEGGADDAGNGNESADDVLTGGGGQDFLFGDTDGNQLSGGGHNDLLFGDQGDDRLEGGRGADLLVDVDGADTLIGGEGDDILIGAAERLNEGFAVSDGSGDLLIGDSAVTGIFPEGNVLSLLDAGSFSDGPPTINIVYMIDTSGSMGDGLDGARSPAEGERRLDFAAKALLTINQLFIDAGLADFVTVKLIPFNDSVVEIDQDEFATADDAGLPAAVGDLKDVGSTNYEVALRAAADWLREDVGTAQGPAERHEDAENFILFFSEGEDSYNPSASLFEDLYDNGSGSPNISNLNIEAFGFGLPEGSPELRDVLGEVETGSEGNGDQVGVVNSATDFDQLLSGDPDLGEDVILAGAGNDFIFGDTLILDSEFAGRESEFAALLFNEEDGAFLRLQQDLVGRDDWIEGGAGNDSIMGQGGNDTIFGDSGADVILAGAGDDFIDGGAGGDRLQGGAGSDIFVLRAADGADSLSGADIIEDFDVGIDSLGLADGLDSSALTITESGAGAVISLQGSGVFLALLQGVSAADIDPTDFTLVV